MVRGNVCRSCVSCWEQKKFVTKISVLAKISGGSVKKYIASYFQNFTTMIEKNCMVGGQWKKGEHKRWTRVRFQPYRTTTPSQKESRFGVLVRLKAVLFVWTERFKRHSTVPGHRTVQICLLLTTIGFLCHAFSWTPNNSVEWFTDCVR